MANSGFRLPPVGGLPAVKTGTCPCVADLIDYAQGQVGLPERQRIETHLRDSNCSHCQSWIAKAAQPSHLPPATSSANRSLSPSTTAADSKWQRLAFRDLKERLRQLDEGN